MKTRSTHAGFSLIELLIVVTIIGIIAAIAIPNLLASRRASNEASAIGTMRAFSSGEATYQSTTGQGNFGAMTDLAANSLIDSAISGSSSSSLKSGYYYTVTLPAVASTGYNTNATAGSTMVGSRRFSSDQSSVIYADTTNPATAQTSTSGTPIN